jgi:amidase
MVRVTHAPRPNDPSPSTAEVAGLDLAGWQRLVSGGEATSAELVETLLRRVEDLDRSGPGLHSVIAVDEGAVERARQLDEERRGGRVRGPLHGVAVIVKDNLDTTAPLPTTAGSLALASPACQPARPATVVKRLVDAGAVVMAKANMSEWANFRSRHSSSGWSAVGGQCRNPHVLDRSPGGSSSGSGAALAAGLAPLTIGTETDGSILCPATLCGVVGIKPTVGLVPRTGVVPISSSQDTAGPLARTVGDALTLLKVIAGDDGTDPATAGRTAGFLDQAPLDGGPLAGARVGVPRQHLFGYSPVADAAVDRALALMAEAGAEIVDPADIETLGELNAGDHELTVLLHEFKVTLEAYLAGRPGQPSDCPRTLAELMAFDDAHPDREMALFGHDIVAAAEATEGLGSDAYREARARCLDLARDRGLDATLARHRLDVLVAPTMGPAWLVDHVNGDAHGGAAYQACAIAGYPSMSVPIGVAHGLPLGLCLMGPAYSEPTLVAMARAVEQAVGVDMTPAWLPTAPV